MNDLGKKAIKSCPTCKGSGRDPKKRKRDCPNRACRRGQVPVVIHCACPCHEGRGSCGFMSCCEYAGVTRASLEAAEEKKKEAEKWTCSRCGYINTKPDPALKISDSALECYECQQWFKEN